MFRESINRVARESFSCSRAFLLLLVFALIANNAHSAGDAYEPDNTFDDATPLYDGIIQSHSIHISTDFDYYTFSLVSPATVEITTDPVKTGIGPLSYIGGDTDLFLYESTGDSIGSLIEYDDWDGSYYYAEITRFLPAGDYCVVVTSYTNNYVIPNYGIKLTKYGEGNPVITAVTSADKSITATWNAYPDALSYNIYYNVDGGAYLSAGTTSGTTWTKNDCINGSTYSVKITATYFITTVQTTGDSNIVSATPLPLSPTINTPITEGDHTITVTWNAIPGASGGYKVYYSTDAGTPDAAEGASPISTMALTQTLTGLTNFQNYTITVVTVGTTSAIDPTPIDSLASKAEIAQPVGPPAPPVIATLTPWDEQVTLTWDAVATAETYNIYYATTSGGSYTLISGITDLSYTVTSLSNSTPYFFIVTAENVTYGESEDSVEETSTPYLPIDAPVITTPLTTGDNFITIEWGAVAGATGYTVEYAETSGAPYTPSNIATEGNSPIDIPSGATTSITLNGLPNFQTFYIVVTGYNALGPGYESTEVSDMPVGPSLPPTGIYTTVNDGTVNLYWAAPPGEEGYLVYYSDTPGGPYVSVATTNEFLTLTGLTNDLPIYIAISTTNTYGEGAKSSEFSVTPRKTLTLLGGGCSASNGVDNASLAMLLPLLVMYFIIRRRKFAGSSIE